MLNYILAKIKRLRNNPIKKLLSGETLFQDIETDKLRLVKYDPDHNLDEDAWFKVDDFSNQAFYFKDTENLLDSKNYEELEKAKFSEIVCLIGVQDGKIYFQKVTPSSFIKQKFIQFGEAAVIDKPTNRIVIKPLPDAVILPESNQLIFREIQSISSIFKGIDQLYKEATEEEVKRFLENDFLKMTGDFDHFSVSKPNRKRISLVLEIVAGMSNDEKKESVAYIAKYCSETIEYDEQNGRFEIDNDNNLKLMLYGFLERFYTTPLSGEKRLANSVENI